MHKDIPHPDALVDPQMRVAPLAIGWQATTLVRLLPWAAFGLVLHLAIWQISEPPTLFSDFYKAYFPAADVLWDTGLKANFPFTEMGAGGFVNVPVLAWLFVPLVPLGEEAAGWVFLALGASATTLAFLLLRRSARTKAGSAPLLLLFLVNGPLVNSLREGNTTHFVLLMLIFALLLLQNGSDFAAGVMIGLCAVIKLPLLLFAAYFCLRRRWLAVAGGASAIGGILLLSVAAFGVDNNISWVSCCVLPFIGRVIPAFNVQSIDGFVLRLVTGTSHLSNWDPVDLPVAYGVIRQVVLAAILGCTAWLVWPAGATSSRPRRTHGDIARDLLEFSLVLDLALLISPISWSHYYALLLLPWGLYSGGLIPWPEDSITRGLLWIGIVLCSLPIIALPLRNDLIGEIAARTLVSVTFFGGAATLMALVRQLRQLETMPDLARRIVSS